MSGAAARATIDTNIAVYALLQQEKAERAAAALAASEFLSVQVLNEYANVAGRKLGRSRPDIAGDIGIIRRSVESILPITEEANSEALRICERYRLSFYDSLMLAVALAGGARTIYSEDLQHNLLIEGSLRIVDPFR